MYTTLGSLQWQVFLFDEIYVHCTIEDLATKINVRLVTKVLEPKRGVCTS